MTTGSPEGNATATPRSDAGIKPTAPGGSNTRVERFRTDASPRIDPVFGDPLSVRASIDHFLELQKSMEGVRERFQVAVNRTLSQLPERRKPGARCPDGVQQRYRHAHQAGAEFLGLGRKLRELYRSIQRADELGDTAGLTPSYRFKARRAAQLYQGLLSDYREMRVAFHDQLGTELRFAGCPIEVILQASNAAGKSTDADDGETELDPADALAWEDGAAEGASPTGADGTTTRVPDKTVAPVAMQGRAAQAIWIEVDNRNCDQPSRLAIDGVTVGEIPAERRSSVRARAGTRSLCLLPANDRRICGEPGTLRKTYLYEGLTLRVHCGQ